MGNDFLDKLPKVQATKAKIDKGDYIKPRSFYTAKETTSRVIEGKKIFSNYSSNKELISRIYKKLRKLNNKKPNTAVKKWASNLNKPFLEEIQMANIYMEKCSVSLAI